MAAPKKKKKADIKTKIDQDFVVSRFGVIFVITSLLAIAIAFMLVRTTVIKRDDWNRMGISSLNKSRAIPSARGEILAADGSILATNLYYTNIMLDLRTDGFRIAEFVDTLPMIVDSLAKYCPRYTSREWMAKFQKDRKSVE